MTTPYLFRPGYVAVPPSSVDSSVVTIIHPLPDDLVISFFVHGVPSPGGSKKAFVLRRKGGAITRASGAPIVNITDAGGEKTKNWRANVAFFARQAYRGELLSDALDVEMTFFVQRPQGHYGSGKNASVLKSSAPKFPVVKPDVLKLARSTEDAMTGVLWVDDNRTVNLRLAKRYGNPGAQITVKKAS